MTKEEFKVLVKGMKAVYTQETFIPDKFAFDMWYGMLGDLDYKITGLAIKAYMAVGKFPPTIADIREKYTEVSRQRLESWDQAWGSVLMAIRRYGYPQEAAALESLSEITQRVVKRFGWQNLCMSEKIEIERANFRDAYNAESKYVKQRDILPLEVKTESGRLLEQETKKISERLTLEGKSDN